MGARDFGHRPAGARNRAIQLGAPPHREPAQAGIAGADLMDVARPRANSVQR
jgi:hypothetical protein